MRKLIDACAIFSALVSVGLIVGGTIIYTQREAIVADIEQQIQGAILGALNMPMPGVPGDTGTAIPLPIPSL